MCRKSSAMSARRRARSKIRPPRLACTALFSAHGPPHRPPARRHRRRRHGGPQRWRETGCGEPRPQAPITPPECQARQITKTSASQFCGQLNPCYANGAGKEGCFGGSGFMAFRRLTKRITVPGYVHEEKCRRSHYVSRCDELRHPAEFNTAAC